MKKNLLLLVLCFFSFSFLMLSCSDDDNSNDNFPGGTSAKLLPVKVKGDRGIKEASYEYDDNNRLIQYKITWPSSKSNDYLLYKINYNTNGNVSEMQYTMFTGGKIDAEYTISYNYNGDLITVINDGLYMVGDQKIKIDGSGRILELKQLEERTNNSVYYSENFEYDTNGNIKSKNTSNSLYSTYTYDDKNGIFKYVNTPQWFLQSQLGGLFTFNNNPVEENAGYRSDEVALRGVAPGFKIEYTYNENGYPTKYTSPYVSDIIGESLDSYFKIEYKSAK
ncbi:hypothetical protein [Dysgonomonas macrotermitis]|uniref:YD repeat-containing protein n=1 Tax=Dysgonomonas macrotermitis TaxID=1346286 RepID=A0A1M5EZG4_9BACT|nr:hypothetical protein [Dysgonomonas macrotermitis]SHF84644.1 hypothetical protein SAMN05444362_1114 [Dysgonomonas macrotermitis]